MNKKNNFLLRFSNWLKAHPLWNLLIVLVYYLLVVLPHEEVGKLIASTLDEPLGRDQYNLIILLLGTIGFLGYLFLNWKGVQEFKERKKTVAFYLFVTLLLIIGTINVLMVINVEMIHFIQYATLTILLFPLFSNFGDTLFFATLMGALDEAYQYWVLAPFRTDYYDFNDVIINLLGVALGLILLFSNGAKNKTRFLNWHQSPVLISTTILTLLFIILYQSGILAIYPTPDAETQAPILLIRNIQPEFWTEVFPSIKFHVLRPLWGLILTVVLFQFYRRLGSLSVQLLKNSV